MARKRWAAIHDAIAMRVNRLMEIRGMLNGLRVGVRSGMVRAHQTPAHAEVPNQPALGAQAVHQPLAATDLPGKMEQPTQSPSPWAKLQFAQT